MTTREFASLEKRITRDLPGFIVNGRMINMLPLNSVLRGFSFEPSAFSAKKFYVSMFFMPLYVPATQLHFTFGHRVGHQWDAQDHSLEKKLTAAIRRELPFLFELRNPRDLATALESLAQNASETEYVNPHSREALAYTYIRAGNSGAAVAQLDKLLESFDTEVPWETEIASRARLVKKVLSTGLDHANMLLSTWEAETIFNLGLPRPEELKEKMS